LGWSGIAAAFQRCYGEGHFAYGLVLIGTLGRIVQHRITRRSGRTLKDLKCVSGNVRML
jgi:hypothetical protein